MVRVRIVVYFHANHFRDGQDDVLRVHRDLTCIRRTLAEQLSDGTPEGEASVAICSTPTRRTTQS